MLRAAEFALFAAPLAAYVFWRMTFARGEPPTPRTLAFILLGLLLFGGALAWFGLHERLPPGARYVPPQLQDGRIIPGHGA